MDRYSSQQLSRFYLSLVNKTDTIFMNVFLIFATIVKKKNVIYKKSLSQEIQESIQY